MFQKHISSILSIFFYMLQVLHLNVLKIDRVLCLSVSSSPFPALHLSAEGARRGPTEGSCRVMAARTRAHALDMTRPFVQQLGRNFQSCPGRIAARRRRPICLHLHCLAPRGSPFAQAPSLFPLRKTGVVLRVAPCPPLPSGPARHAMIARLTNFPP